MLNVNVQGRSFYTEHGRCLDVWSGEVVEADTVALFKEGFRQTQEQVGNRGIPTMCK